jgi:hypothetical protein
VVGAPAEVRRPTTERHLEMIDRIARSYHFNGQRFKEAGLQDPDQEKFTDPTV